MTDSNESEARGSRYSGPHNVAILHHRPLVIFSMLFFFDFRHLEALSGVEAVIFNYPAWYIDQEGAQKIGAGYCAYAARNPKHSFVMMAPDEDIRNALQHAGVPALVSHPNIFVRETVFRPLRRKRQFHAIYNARISRGKRHYLASEVESLALIYYYLGRNREYLSIVQEQLPNATYLNDLAGDYRFFSADEVNEWLARARVGLALSAVEGGCFSSVEYLLAGLPVVSTHCKGGRERFLTRDVAIICDESPRAVADAVKELGARDQTAEEIRRITLKSVLRERRSTIQSVKDYLSNQGLGKSSIEIRSRSFPVFSRRYLSELVR